MPLHGRSASRMELETGIQNFNFGNGFNFNQICGTQCKALFKYSLVELGNEFKLLMFKLLINNNFLNINSYLE